MGGGRETERDDGTPPVDRDYGTCFEGNARSVMADGSWTRTDGPLGDARHLKVRHAVRDRFSMSVTESLSDYATPRSVVAGCRARATECDNRTTVPADRYGSRAG